MNDAGSFAGQTVEAARRLLTARLKEISVQLSSIPWETSDRPLDAARFVRYLLAVLPRAVTRVLLIDPRRTASGASLGMPAAKQQQVPE